MICYVLAIGKQHLGPHVVVGYGIKIFWPGLFTTSPDHLEYCSWVLMQDDKDDDVTQRPSNREVISSDSGAPTRQRHTSGASYLRKFGNPSISKILVVI